MLDNDEIARRIAERLYPEEALKMRIEVLEEEALHWHNCRERLHTEIRAIIGNRAREQRSGDADGDLIEDVRAAVTDSAQSTSQQGVRPAAGAPTTKAPQPVGDQG